MKEMFTDEKVEGIKETGKTEDLTNKNWWVNAKCSICGGDQKLWIQANGIVRCNKHYVNRKGD